MLERSSNLAPHGASQRIIGLDKNYCLFKLAKFGIASSPGSSWQN